jgi:hemin uptake protein HemP
MELVTNKGNDNAYHSHVNWHAAPRAIDGPDGPEDDCCESERFALLFSHHRLTKRAPHMPSRLAGHNPQHGQAPAGRPGSDSPAPVIDSLALFGNAEVLLIEHRGLTYTLRKTRNGKLILTK